MYFSLDILVTRGWIFRVYVWIFSFLQYYLVLLRVNDGDDAM